MPKINKEEYQVLRGLDDEWKWIARDKNGSLFAYLEKPLKDPYSRDWGFTGGEWFLIKEILFEFIQWEDEEPHNIQELIKEYEIETGMRLDFGKIKVVDIDTSKLATRNGYIYVKESEKTEVEKNIKWANREIEKVRDLLNNKRYEEEVDDFTTGVLSGLKKALSILDQLDEREVLSQEFIDKNKKYNNVHDIGYYIPVENLQNLLVPTLSETETVEITEEQAMEWLDNNDFYCHATAETVLENAVDKGELGYYGTKYSVVEEPVIPKFVAEWIEENKKKNRSLVFAIKHIYDENEIGKSPKLYIWMETDDNEEVFARAWLDGFMVEEEQKYILSINITDKASKTNYETFLNKRGIFHSMENESFNSEEFSWTEEEIKDLESGEILFEHFATKIEELEE